MSQTFPPRCKRDPGHLFSCASRKKRRCRCQWTLAASKVWGIRLRVGANKRVCWITFYWSCWIAIFWGINPYRRVFLPAATTILGHIDHSCLFELLFLGHMWTLPLPVNTRFLYLSWEQQYYRLYWISLIKVTASFKYKFILILFCHSSNNLLGFPTVKSSYLDFVIPFFWS